MNKITSTLAGLAFVAAASVAPALAQGNLFSPPGTFTFTGAGTATFTANTLPGQTVGFNPGNGSPDTTATFSLTGTQVGGPGSVVYQVTLLTITPTGGVAFTEGPLSGPGGSPFDFTVVPVGSSGGVSVASVGSAADTTTFNLVAPVPEASTVVSFGALLALGGLAVLRRKSVKNAA